MKNYKTFLRTDLMIQMGFMSLIVASGVSSLGTLDPTPLLGGMFVAFFLGLWQVTSAFVIGTFLKCKKRWKYLGFVVLYFISFFSLTSIDVYISSTILQVLVGAIFLAFPIIFAFWYLFKTYTDYRGGFYRVRDFWDLK